MSAANKARSRLPFVVSGFGAASSSSACSRVSHVPVIRLAPAVLLVALARERFYFFFHYQMHQLQSGLAHKLPYAILQQMRDLGHGQDQLHGRVLFGGDPAELLHGSLLFGVAKVLHDNKLVKRHCQLGQRTEILIP